MNKLKSIPALIGALIISALLLSSCGSIAGDSVVAVGDNQITKADLNHWVRVAALSSGIPNATVPDAPDFKRCVAAAKKAAGKPKKGVVQPSDAQLLAQCKTQYQQYRDGALNFLVEYQWFLGQAKDMGISTSDAEALSDLKARVKQAGLNDKQYRKYLKDHGITEADLVQQFKLQSLQTKIKDQVTKDAGNVTDQQIKDYYEKNRAQFTQPERRDLLLVLAKDKAKAEAAQKALKSGTPFDKVVKQYSIDQLSKTQGGKMLSVSKGTGQVDPTLDQVVFAAKKNALEGPIKTARGYYLFKVTNIAKSSTIPYNQAQQTIRSTLLSQNQTKAQQDFSNTFLKKWTAATSCRKGFVIQLCSEASGTPTKPPPPIKNNATPQASTLPIQPGQ